MVRVGSRYLSSLIILAIASGLAVPAFRKLTRRQHRVRGFQFSSFDRHRAVRSSDSTHRPDRSTQAQAE